MTQSVSPQSVSAEPTDAAGDGATPPTFDRATRLIIAAILAGALLLLLGFGTGWFSANSAGEQSAPTTTSAEAGFARDMQVHHQQAVQMSVLLRERSDNEEVRQLALDIELTQSQQAGQMYAWLVSWGLPQASEQPRMTWMTLPTLDGEAGHAHDDSTDGTTDGTDGGHTPGEPMPGLASAAELERLTTVSGAEADRLYLELIIDHHRGGVEMAEAVLARSNNTMVTNLAQSMATAQQSEIDYMQDLQARI